MSIISFTSSLLIISSLFSGAWSIKLWDTPGVLPKTIPASCRAMLTADIDCGPRLVTAQEVTYLRSLNESLLTEYCNSTCTSAIQTWANNVGTRCGSTVYDFGLNISMAGNDIAEPLRWAHGVACLQDRETDEFCMLAIANGTVSECDDCALQYVASRVNVNYAPDSIGDDTFSEMVSSCSVAATLYPVPTASSDGPTQPTPTEDPIVRTCRGTNYTVQAGDSCKSIAADNSLAIDRFLADNSIDFQCESLTQGSTVCIGKSCLLHEVKADEKCADFLKDNKFTLTELVAWNPSIHANCDNIDIFVGRTICFSPPGTDEYEDVTITWSDPWTTPPGSWIAGQTVGTDAPNTTVPVIPTIIPTVTATANASNVDVYEKYTEFCPITYDDYDAGFDWSDLSDECKTMLIPYCSPFPTGDPLPSTSFPSTCLPTAV